MSQDELQKEILEFEELETQATQVEHSYTADDIQVLEGLEAVRRVVFTIWYGKLWTMVLMRLWQVLRIELM